jgi:acyl carrier protein
MLDQAQVETTLSWLRTLLAARLGIEATVLDPDQRLHRYGLTSLTAASIVALISERIGRTLPPTLLWDYPTPRRLAAFLDGQDDADGRMPIRPMAPDDQVAIVGMACRFPGAESPVLADAM